MSKFSGKNISVEITGTSHGESVNAIVKGFPRYEFDTKKLKEFLERRKATKSSFSTSRIEADEPIFKGVENNLINGDFEVTVTDYKTEYGLK